ncbi:MAG: nitrogenase-stabilizing/protective protein NifW [Candidatus Competibacteraceae bacterium]|uniref:Nitrogenase-stabilizing/protective protein NifW n=1 Tax=Candidatus Contendobacter odensis Run_B_J11 TaxID=1400861 RepID=A0A7U7G7Z3_9GAMM|nr:nitrogenase-stabilizing/protective protein NifW [Candidatus Contendobacter odensis]MBK8535405.1 nitrogenase-stabilizing/protective protein NifW [Candidatus Competibacteraceae bacterium]MBK8752580.1 nitrogenase-stabilizing/protective protein NifW [Candidatus Competibacteraceae bacterium]CDH43200.1 putative nitrogenase-stabilizing/protective protein nifW [Candidatus Contendobacter odensis Run_B_J11]
MTDPQSMDLTDLVSAEDFLDHFGIAYDPAVVQVCRLHILQRLHNYLAAEPMAASATAESERYARCLKRAYQDFVDSDPQTEKVFSVFRRHSGETRISLDSLRRSA